MERKYVININPKVTCSCGDLVVHLLGKYKQVVSCWDGQNGLVRPVGALGTRGVPRMLPGMILPARSFETRGIPGNLRGQRRV